MRRRSSPTSFLGQASSRYKDNIVVAAGIDLDGRLQGAHIIRDNETPGIGSKIVDEEFLSRFEGLQAEDIELRADGGRIDAVSGSTVSSETVADIVREQVKQLQGYLE
ncbi:MAG: FMN-binding protein [Spirochaetaceae bacterium]